MLGGNNDNWGRTRQMFADQFQPDGNGFIYRRSQKGEAIRVSAAERDRFVEQFGRNLARSMWMLGISMAVVLGGIIAVTTYLGKDASQITIFGGMAVAIVPYFSYFRWAWAVPARELAGRTPIAGGLSPEEAQRLKFQRMTYRQLAAAAFGGLMLPFIGSAREDVFSGWNRLWLVFGGSMALLAAVQALRKWRFEQQNSLSNLIPSAPTANLTAPADDAATSPTKSRLWRYIPLALILLGLAFILLTSVGKQFAHTPGFMTILMLGAGAWALFTVVQGIRIGRIEPFVRGMHDTYERATQPKRFWASMAWNGVFGCGCFFIAFEANREAVAQSIQDRCYNSSDAYLPEDALTACNQLIKDGERDAYTYFGRGYAYERLGRPGCAISDLSQVVRLTPDNASAYYDRALAFKQIGDTQRATADFEVAFRLDPKLCHNCVQSSS